jgi:hypothetical protein
MVSHKFQFEPVHLLFFLILAAGVVLRIYRINFGLPDLFHPDEPFEMHRALRLASGSFDWDRDGKGGFYFLVFLMLGFSFSFLKLSGVVPSAEAFGYYFISHESGFYLAARSISAALSIFTIYVVYRIGKENGGRLVGLCAALWIAVSQLNFIHAHYATVDITLTCLLSLVFLFLLRYLRGGSSRNMIYAGIFCGLSLATKMPAALIIFPLILTYLLRNKNIPRAERKISRKHFCIAFSLFVIIAIALQPGYLKRLMRINKDFASLYGHSQQIGTENPSADKTMKPEKINLFAYYIDIVKRDLGLPVFIIFIFSSCLLPTRRSSVEPVLLSFMIPYFLSISATTSIFYFPRYALPIIFPAIIIASRGCGAALDSANRKIAVNQQIFAWMIGILGFCLISYPAVLNALEITEKFDPQNPRSEAKQWIYNNLSADSKILMEGSNEHRSQLLVQIDNSDRNFESMIKTQGAEDAGKRKYWQLRRKYLNTMQVPRYDLILIPLHMPWMSYDRFLSSDIEYVVLDVFHLKNNLTLRNDLNATSRVVFYQRLTADVRTHLVKSFGGKIEIYRKIEN